MSDTPPADIRTDAALVDRLLTEQHLELRAELRLVSDGWDNAEVMEQGPIAETQIDSEFYGLVATRPERRKNLDPTIHEAMNGEDRKHWEEAM